MKINFIQCICIIALFSLSSVESWRRRRRSGPSKITTAVPTTISNPTTEMSTSAVTTAAVTTAAVTTAAPDHSPHKNTYLFPNDTHPCLKVQMTAYIAHLNDVINVTESAKPVQHKSSCDSLTVNISEAEYFTLDFSKTDKDYYQLSYIQLELNSTDQDYQANATVNWGKTKINDSYLCDGGFTRKIGPNATMVATSVQFQAFGGMKKTEFGAAENCKDLSPIIPIVVGAVLAFLVLIVIIAYLIGRRRSRSGYEEI